MNKEHWTRRAIQALLLLVVIAVGARFVYGLLAPLAPVAIAGVVLFAAYAFVLRRRRW